MAEETKHNLSALPGWQQRLVQKHLHLARSEHLPDELFDLYEPFKEEVASGRLTLSDNKEERYQQVWAWVEKRVDYRRYIPEPASQETAEAILEIVQTTLSEREKLILQKRTRHPPVTYKEIGKQLGVSATRIGEIATNTLKKIREPITQVIDQLRRPQLPPAPKEQHREPEWVIPDNLLQERVENLSLPPLVARRLTDAGIESVGQLIQLSDDDILKIRMFGRGSRGWVREMLRDKADEFGVRVCLGMQLPPELAAEYPLPPQLR